MTKSKHTKRALLMSVLAMLICVAMLAGSTFAWFTDSVSTGVNKIVAGNLDVELEYATEFDADGNITKWDPVTDQVSLFSNLEKDGTDNLWEPGHTEVVYLKVTNKGTLALKYKFAVNVINPASTAKNVYNENFKLSDYLVFGKVESTEPMAMYTDRAEAWTEAGSVTGLNTYTKENVKLLPGKEEYVALIVYMPTSVGNEANYRGTKPTISLGVTLVAAQTPNEEDSFGDDYDTDAVYPVSNEKELEDALKEGGDIILKNDITLSEITVSKDANIDLNDHVLKAPRYHSALNIQDAAVTIKNGTIEATPGTAGSALYAYGSANVTLENCTIKTNANKTYAVCTNGSESLNSTIVIRNSTISAPTVAGKKGYAAYIPAGNVTFENCDVTGHLFICGGNVTLDGGTYTATGFNGQNQIWDKGKTVEYAKSIVGGNAYTMGDSIFIADRRDGYTLSSLIIRNITFNTEIPGVGTAYAIKYVDMNPDGAVDRVPYVIENNTFNDKIDGADPVMYIDLTGNDITNP